MKHSGHLPLRKSRIFAKDLRSFPYEVQEKGKLHVAPQDDKDLKEVNWAGGKTSTYVLLKHQPRNNINFSCFVKASAGE